MTTIKVEDIIEITHGTLETFAMFYKTAMSDRERQEWDSYAQKYIQGSTENEAFRLGFEKFYESQKVKR